MEALRKAEENFVVLKAFNDLVLDVVSKDLCTKCGMCVSSCQVHAISMTDEGPKSVGPCRQCEACYYGCPRSPATSEELLKASLSSEKKDDILGSYNKIVSARTVLSEVKSVAQDGGVVTTLLIYALEEGLIDGGIVASKSTIEAWKPVPKVALSINDVLEAAGTKYSNCPSLVALKDALYGYDLSKVCVVGVPCQVTAARNVKVQPKAARKIGDKIAFIIGLFCMESFPHVKLAQFLTSNGIDIAKVSKFDIKEGKFRVYMGDAEVLSVPIRNLKDYANRFCETCRDLTSWYADVSVGAIGSGRDWSTVIVRSDEGAKLFDGAVQNGYLEVKDIESDGIESLRKIAKRKASKN
ncbi:MAG: Coenzyme F420 hydrogenase/dehydrogenase, beta subunit C-terminal domain [Candidatus Nezhaarchaeales archaeon]|nr:MAG: coenzyme F420 hydrogenase subunit beta [Candidatus Nezhaarchaeota archaeon WYZ-LMO8]TDA37004.1 MAG: coenzyme F420 hydrogenase subunit beta [Candidatus Nezhaarchaeota archaeon WYZ-LMO7]